MLSLAISKQYRVKIKDPTIKIRKGQLWKKKNGEHEQLVLITGNSKRDCVHTVRYDNRKIVHHIYKKDLLRFYELVAKNVK